eukprot:2329813-Amphidinium_carterae.1
MQSPSERAMFERMEVLSCGGFLLPCINAVESMLRGELCEKLPQFIIKRCMAERKVTAVQLLTMAMREILPAYHTVK